MLKSIAVLLNLFASVRVDSCLEELKAALKEESTLDLIKKPSHLIYMATSVPDLSGYLLEHPKLSPLVQTENVVSLLKETRDLINVYLGRKISTIGETGGYRYPSDVSGRLTKLQSILGDYQQFISSSFPSLMQLILKPDRINLEVMYLLKQHLNSLLTPVKGCPPVKNNFVKLIHHCVANLDEAITLINFLNDRESACQAKSSQVSQHPQLVELEEKLQNEVDVLDELNVRDENVSDIVVSIQAKIDYLKTLPAASVCTDINYKQATKDMKMLSRLGKQYLNRELHHNGMFQKVKIYVNDSDRSDKKEALYR